MNPNILAYTQVKGLHNYMAEPLAPRGTKVIIHENKAQRGTWGNKKGVEGFYISNSSSNHYRNFICYLPKTQSIRVTNTIEFLPSKTDFPVLNPEDNIVLLLKEMAEILNKEEDQLFTTKSHQIRQAIGALRKIFKQTRPTKSSDSTINHNNEGQQTSKGAQTEINNDNAVTPNTHINTSNMVFTDTTNVQRGYHYK